jgi:Tfp pilus assembly protein FimT
MVELVFVIAIVLIITATAIIQTSSTNKNATAETGLQTTLGQLRGARDLAIGQRRRYRVTFTAPRTIQLDQVVIDPITKVQSFTFVSSIDLPKDVQFIAVNGIPSGSANTPDSLPTTGPAIDFDVDYGGGGNQIVFQPDGRALDATGRLNNGVVYVARPGELMSSRAVSVLGATGRVKGWHLIKSGTAVVWTQ